MISLQCTLLDLFCCNYMHMTLHICLIEVGLRQTPSPHTEEGIGQNVCGCCSPALQNHKDTAHLNFKREKHDLSLTNVPRQPLEVKLASGILLSQGKLQSIQKHVCYRKAGLA